MTYELIQENMPLVDQITKSYILKADALHQIRVHLFD